MFPNVTAEEEASMGEVSIIVHRSEHRIIVKVTAKVTLNGAILALPDNRST